MYFRDTIQKFKKNDNFTTKRGFLYFYLQDKKQGIKVVNVSDQEKDEGLNLKQIYQKYGKMIEESKDTISIFEYFEIDQNGQDVENHIPVVQMQLSEIEKKLNDTNSALYKHMHKDDIKND